MIRGLSRRLVRWLQPLAPRSQGGVTILGYHLVGADSGAPVDLPLPTFRAQMIELKRVARTIPFARALAESAPSAEPRVVLSFDDAYENFYTQAWPVLRELGLPAVLYVPVEFVEGGGEPPIRGTEGLPPVSWTQLAEMCGSGLLEIGSHGLTHRDLRLLDVQTLRRELRESRDRLGQKLGVPVESFCYPRGLWSGDVEREVAEVYSSAVIGGGGKALQPGRSLLRLERVPVRRDMPVSLQPVLRSAVWLEERVASRVRLLLR